MQSDLWVKPVMKMNGTESYWLQKQQRNAKQRRTYTVSNENQTEENERINSYL